MLTPSQSAQPDGSPLVTMIVLCYNQARFAVETLESVKAQTYENTELVIVDDCSTDDSVAVIDRWLQENGVQCNFIHHQKNQGICKSLNEALRLATGKYISMIASDDIWLPDKIERQVAIMESQPESFGVLYSDAYQIDENSEPLHATFIGSLGNIAQVPQGQILDALLRQNFIPGPTALIRRACYEKVGGYDENLPWEDWDMWMRIARHYSFLYSTAPSVKYRIHPQSLTRSDPVGMLKDGVAILLKQFRIGDLNADQRAALTQTLLNFSEELYRRNSPESRDIFLAVSQASGNKRARWLYRFTRLGLSFRSWQRAYSFRVRLLGVRRIAGQRQRA